MPRPFTTGSPCHGTISILPSRDLPRKAPIPEFAMSSGTARNRVDFVISAATAFPSEVRCTSSEPT